LFSFLRENLSLALSGPKTQPGWAPKDFSRQDIHSISPFISMASGEPIDADPEPILWTGERRSRIREILSRQGRVTVNELSKLFRVTVVTIRSDLDTSGG
jgi:hypothetical protein